jgi:hypothetical protein
MESIERTKWQMPKMCLKVSPDLSVLIILYIYSKKDLVCPDLPLGCVITPFLQYFNLERFSSGYKVQDIFPAEIFLFKFPHEEYSVKVVGKTSKTCWKLNYFGVGPKLQNPTTF